MTRTSHPPIAHSAASYAALLALAAGALALIQRRGATLVAPVARVAAAHAPATAAAPLLPRVLLALLVVVAAARLMGALFRRLGQAAVVGEVVAGIMLGPSLLGRVAPDAAALLFPREVTPHLSIVGQLGVVLFMFLVGVELDTAALLRRSRASVAISHASIAAPFLMGAALALWAYPRFSHRGVPFPHFALFLGAAMSVTAFPVLARILAERRMQRSPLGVIALGCAAVDDATAWCLLALIVGVARARAGGGLVTVAGAAAYVAVMLLVVRPLVERFVHARERRAAPVGSDLAVVLGALLASALAAEAAGVHALFGAFLLGALVPHDSAVARDLTERLEGLTVSLLLPAYFASTGLRVQIGLVTGASQWLACAAIVLVACAGKFGGTMAAARYTGLGWRDAATLGVLMNTRGLMELVVLNVGLDLGLLSPTLFAMMVLMAVATTLLTAPALGLLAWRGAERSGAPGEALAAG